MTVSREKANEVASIHPIEKAKETVAEKVRIDPPVELHCDDRIKRWAWENGYTLVFLAVMFVVTWVFIVVENNV